MNEKIQQIVGTPERQQREWEKVSIGRFNESETFQNDIHPHTCEPESQAG